jgi:hypothetical protein
MWMAALLALLSVVGAWHAWRRNPAYSNRSTLRLVGVTALSIIALTLVIAAAVNLTIHRSPAVAMGTMFAVIVVGALGMIFIIQYATTATKTRRCRPRETLSMHEFELHAESPLDSRPKCCHAPLTDALAPRRYRLRLSERHLGDAVTGDDVAIRQQVVGGVCVPIVKILVAPVARAELPFQHRPVSNWGEQCVQRIRIVETRHGVDNLGGHRLHLI